jgi:hypothetical protein
MNKSFNILLATAFLASIVGCAPLTESVSASSTTFKPVRLTYRLYRLRRNKFEISQKGQYNSEMHLHHAVDRVVSE